MLGDWTETVASSCDKKKHLGLHVFFPLVFNIRPWHDGGSLKEAALTAALTDAPLLSSLVSYHSVLLHSPWWSRWVTVSLQERQWDEAYVCLLLFTHRHCQINIYALSRITWRVKSDLVGNKLIISNQWRLLFSQLRCIACYSHSWWSTYLQQVSSGPQSSAYWH